MLVTHLYAGEKSHTDEDDCPDMTNAQRCFWALSNSLGRLVKPQQKKRKNFPKGDNQESFAKFD